MPPAAPAHLRRQQRVRRTTRHSVELHDGDELRGHDRLRLPGGSLQHSAQPPLDAREFRLRLGAPRADCDPCENMPGDDARRRQEAVIIVI